MKRAVLLFTAIFVAAAAANAQGLAIGAATDNFSLTDTGGKTQTFNELKGPKGAVIIFVSSQCPVVRGYNERMNQLALDYKAKGINVIGVNSNVTESPGEIKMHGDATYKFAVMIDKNNALANKLDAHSTPEVFLFDAKNVLVYHGAIDDDRSGRNVTEPYLRNAFDAVLAGKKVERSLTTAVGCSIKRAGDEN
jgi:peroxiredoxin